MEKQAETSTTSFAPTNAVITNSELNVTAVELPGRNATNHRPSMVSLNAKEQGIFWRTPTTMIASLLLAITCSAGLHGYYSSLDGTVVGRTSDQQNALRIGTFLALVAQISLVYSVQKASVQWLWRELKSHIVTMSCADSGFASTNDPSSFFSVEMWTKLKLASVLAMASWLIPISTLFTPTTLNVHTVMLTKTRSMDVPSLSIAQAGAYERFTYAVNGTSLGSQRFLGPRTVIQRLALAAATTGEVLSLLTPAPNATYEQTFFGPYVQCANSSSQVRQEIDKMIGRSEDELDASIGLVSLDYFAVVPALSNVYKTTEVGIEVANLTDIDAALHASNQLWMYFSSYKASANFTEPKEPHYLTCELYNASYTTRFQWENGRQDLRVLNRILLHPVPYPVNPSTSEESEEAMAYSSVMWALSNQLTGSIAFYQDMNTSDDATQQAVASRVYSTIDTRMAQTVLVGSSDLNSHFMQNHLLGDDYDKSPFSDQRLQDMTYAGDRPLAILISELSSNTTLSLLNDPLLAPRVPTKVDVASPANIYVYQSRNVLLTYCITGAVAIAANALGLYAFWRSRLSYDLSFSAIACSTRGIHFSEGLRAHERRGALPLEKHLARTRLKFYDGDAGWWGFGAAGDNML